MNKFGKNLKFFREEKEGNVSLLSANLPGTVPSALTNVISFDSCSKLGRKVLLLSSFYS